MLIRSLISLNATVDAVGIDGTTPLIIAAENGRADNCRILLEFNADLHSQTSKGQTAFQIASDQGFEDVKRVLSMFQRDTALSDE
jgi:ankyrin repeat protein